MRFHVLWKHTGFIWILLFTPKCSPNGWCSVWNSWIVRFWRCPVRCHFYPFLPLQFDVFYVPSNNDLVAGICYAHRQHCLYLAPYIKASWSRPWVSQSLPWIRAAKGLRTLIHRWQCYSFWTVCWHCSSKKVPAIPRHPWCRLKRIDMLQCYTYSSGKDHLSSLLCNQWQGRRRNGLIYNDLYTPIPSCQVISYPILICCHTQQ